MIATVAMLVGRAKYVNTIQSLLSKLHSHSDTTSQVIELRKIIKPYPTFKIKTNINAS